jgi:tRNA-modifying protein YgfZ
MDSLKELQANAGAVFGEEETPIYFQDSGFDIDNFHSQILLCDRSHFGLLKLTGDDRGRFLHNQTTNQIQLLPVGKGCETVFINSTGRNIDLVTVYIKSDEILLLVSPEQNKILSDWMDRYIFPFDKVKVQDLTSSYAIFTLIGDNSRQLLEKCLNDDFFTSEKFTHQTINIEDTEILVTVDCGLNLSGYNLIMPQEKASLIWKKLTAFEPILIGSQDLERLRIHQGKPKPTAELTEEYNPLETGLWEAISFDKGCYIGQETIARLNTYKGVKQRLWGLKLEDKIDLESDRQITLDGEKIGKITSYDQKANFALGYIRTKAGGEGLTVVIGETKATVVSLPSITHEYYS